ncbi:hypothetical protein [Roseococcus sp. YIM B11640]|uniref:hypothetical protein n=1 Tax=Roseococcus sp. YIM B11640 TaxID=3133973 RepID=UPI003C7BFB87
MRALALLLAVAACAPRAPDPPPAVCRIAPVTVSTHDQITPATRAELRRVNRELRRHCAG